MSEETKQCPKCDGRMVQGFILDVAHGSVWAQTWYSGPPEKKGGIFSIFSPGVKTREKTSHPIGTFRCERCGFLESYAGDEFGMQ